ncbi:MAG: flagellar basal body L-ring protein FlgH [Betaproteobacteria bacterium]|nr:flagellar basal body L-ring protein FlgH [Betaproteobacteria bacterium]
MKTLCIGLFAVILAGCNAMPPQPMSHSPGFTPVVPPSRDALAAPTGAIYNSRLGDNLFGRGRNYQVGDVITVILDEESSGSRNSEMEASRKSSNNMVPNALNSRVNRLLGQGLNLRNTELSTSGGGEVTQGAKLTGAVGVTVVEVQSNGNLVVRGEKQLALNEGTEVIQVAGIIRPDDITSNNVVHSRRLANAQIAYRGTGDLATTSKPGWGMSLLLKLLPF